MTSNPVLDMEALLRPISEEHPTGLPLRDETLITDYYAMRDAATDARTAERRLVTFVPLGDGNEDHYKPKPPNWAIVLTQATDTLSNKSKDLWVVAWMIEALCREHGFAGLRDGFRLARAMCERFWDELHPRGEVATRVAQLAGLNGEEGDGTLIAPIRAIPITEGRSPGPYSFADYTTAMELEKETSPERRRSRLEDGQVSLKQFEASAAESSSAFLSELLAAIDATISEFDQLTNFLVLHCKMPGSDKSDAPPTSNISNTLAQCRDRVAILAGATADAGSQNLANSGDRDAAAAAAGGGKWSTATVSSRDEAFRLLLSVADFFEKAEPHSPVSYGLRQVVRWGRLSLPDLLAQLIDDSDTRSRLFRQIGIEVKEGS